MNKTEREELLKQIKNICATILNDNRDNAVIMSIEIVNDEDINNCECIKVFQGKTSNILSASEPITDRIYELCTQ